jgi:translation initiation factor 2 beta subunit (eIF-2beta)/eIF-5
MKKDVPCSFEEKIEQRNSSEVSDKRTELVELHIAGTNSRTVIEGFTKTRIKADYNESIPKH